MRVHKDIMFPHSDAWLFAFCCSPPWVDYDHPLAKVEEALRNGCACELCEEHTRQPFVTPCGHLFCLDCVASDR